MGLLFVAAGVFLMVLAIWGTGTITARALVALVGIAPVACTYYLFAVTSAVADQDGVRRGSIGTPLIKAAEVAGVEVKHANWIVVVAVLHDGSEVTLLRHVGTFLNSRNDVLSALSTARTEIERRLSGTQ